MLCSKCKKKQATVFWEETANGETKRVALCTTCSEKKNPPIAIKSELDERLFSSLFPLSSEDKKEKCCPLCGLSAGEIIRSGACGCPTCYTTFEKELLPTVKALHSGERHSGRMPERLEREREKKETLARLKSELRAAIDAEDFEKCPLIRDSIRKLS